MNTDKKTVEEVVERYSALLGSPKIIGAEDWIDMAGNLQLLRYYQGIRRLALDIAANKKRKEIRGTATSVADAELELKTTQEYEDWQTQETLMDDLERFERIARNEAQIKKANNF